MIDKLRKDIKSIITNIKDDKNVEKHYPWLLGAFSDILTRLKSPENVDGNSEVYFVIDAMFVDKGDEPKFRKWLEASFDMEDHPKADTLWNLAWDKGHAHGYHEVYNEYNDLLDLVR